VARPTPEDPRRDGSLRVRVEEAGWHVVYQVELNELAPYRELQEKATQRFFRFRDVVEGFLE